MRQLPVGRRQVYRPASEPVPAGNVSAAAGRPTPSPGQRPLISLDRQDFPWRNVQIGRATSQSPQSGTPDLKVVAITMTPAAGQTRVEVTVTNAGFAFADFTTSWWVFALFNEQTQLPAAPVSEGALGPLDSATHVTLWVPDSPQDTVEYIVNRIEPTGLTDDVGAALLQTGSALDPTTEAAPLRHRREQLHQ